MRLADLFRIAGRTGWGLFLLFGGWALAIAVALEIGDVLGLTAMILGGWILGLMLIALLMPPADFAPREREDEAKERPPERLPPN